MKSKARSNPMSAGMTAALIAGAAVVIGTIAIVATSDSSQRATKPWWWI